MPLYDYACHDCKAIAEVFHKIDDMSEWPCELCGKPMEKLISAVALKRPDAEWIRSINGVVNDLERAQSGKEEYIETREQARDHVNKLYSDPHPRVQALRKRYLERF